MCVSILVENIRLIRKKLKYQVDDVENFQGLNFSPMFGIEARKRDAPTLVLIKLSYLGGISPE